MSAKIMPFGLSRPAAEALIHRLAAEGCFTLEPHCTNQMTERDMPMRLVLMALERGSVNQGPVLDEFGDWRCRIRKRVAGRLVRVVVAIHAMCFLYVVTVF